MEPTSPARERSASSSLFDPTGSDSLPAVPALIGAKCRCGHVFFPAQFFGCERCGRYGEDLVETRLSGQGIVRAAVVVHQHFREIPRAPFTVVDLALDDGPVIRGLMMAGTKPPRAGDVVTARIVDGREGGAPAAILRFEVAKGGAQS